MRVYANMEIARVDIPTSDFGMLIPRVSSIRYDNQVNEYRGRGRGCLFPFSREHISVSPDIFIDTTYPVPVCM